MMYILTLSNANVAACIQSYKLLSRKQRQQNSKKKIETKKGRESTHRAARKSSVRYIVVSSSSVAVAAIDRHDTIKMMIHKQTHMPNVVYAFTDSLPIKLNETTTATAATETTTTATNTHKHKTKNKCMNQTRRARAFNFVLCCVVSVCIICITFLHYSLT